MKQSKRNLVLLFIGGFIIIGVIWWTFIHQYYPKIVIVKPSTFKPNILLITLESLRYDHANCANDGCTITPHLCALSEESVVYTNAYSVTSWTLSAHASLFTGLYPSSHQTKTPLSKLDDAYTTIAEVLAENGYQCAGIVSGPYLRSEYNLHQGFEYYNDSPSDISHSEAHSDITNPEMEELLEDFIRNKRDPERPFYLFAYFWDIHYDYLPPAPYDTMFVKPEHEFIDVTNYESGNTITRHINENQRQYILSQYKGEIRWTDEHLGRLFKLLKEEGLWDNTVIILTADHGEEFFEHGKKGHKNNLYEESIHVPLIIKYAKEKVTGRDFRLVSFVDIFPTITDLIGISNSIPNQGVSLLNSRPKLDRQIFFELLSLWYFPQQKGIIRKENQFYAVRKGENKLHWFMKDNLLQLYHLTEDPLEKENMIFKNPTLTKALMKEILIWKQEMDTLSSNFQKGGKAKLDPKELERLRSLGYIQ